VTKSIPAPADHWAISARASSGIVTAGVTLPGIELALLGIPPGFSEPEIQTWLRDLAGVAIETSRSDRRSRPIPPLLHHALTGLLFSQTELWSHTGHPLPFAAVFVDGPQGVAFGWVGRARAVLLVNGEPHEPQWVIVRDESGQEAMSASLPSDAHVLLTLEYWPTGGTSTPAPASIDAEFGPALADEPAAIEHDAPERELNERVSSIEADDVELELEEDDVAESPLASTPPAAPAAPAGRASLPTGQPGLAPDPTGMRFAGTEGSQSLPSTKNPSSGTFAMPGVPKAAPAPRPEPTERHVAAEHDEAEPAESEDGHPVGRWLQKLIGFKKSAPPTLRKPQPEPPAPPAATTAARPPALHPPGARPTPRVEPAALEPAPLPSPEIDIEEPHALPPTAGTRMPEWMPPVPPMRAATPGTGLAAAGMSEILGASKPAPGAPAAGAASATGRPRIESPTAKPSATPPAAPPVKGAKRGTDAPGASPHPVLEVNPPGGAGERRGPIHIDHEPVGADTTFAIPKLPPRGAVTGPAGPSYPGRPVGRAVPDAPAAKPTPADPRAAQAAPAAKQPAPAAPQAKPGVPAAKPPAPSAPARRQGEAPEPPTEFLERFAASMRTAPGLEPTPDAPPPAPPAAAPSAPAARGTPASPPAPVERRAGQRPVIPAAAQAQPPAGPPLRRSHPELPPEAATPIAPARPQPEPRTPLSQRPIETPVTAPVLRAPSESAPVQVTDDRELMRELPLGAGEPTDEVPEGMLVATPAKARPRPPRRGEWPELDALDHGPPPLWRRPWVVGLFVAVMLGIGWLVGHSQAPDNDVHATPMTRLLRTVGLGGARFTANIDTDPPGAWIAVDGKDLGRRTPSTLELVPGTYALTLSMPDLGEVKVDLKGRRGQAVKVNEALHGSLDVIASDPSIPVQMSLDGAPQGYLPVHVAKLPPGLHELQFSGPKMQPWAQNVNVGIRKNTKVVSKPMLSPATGVVQVLAQMNDENGSAPLPGASVYVDGALSGTTPATIELPRGPHSLRVQFEGVTAPIQVIDLPGGNKRFATFQFGVDTDLPPLKLDGDVKRLLSKNPAVISATLDGLDADDLREAWLHVLTPDGLWSRFEMTIESGPRGAALTANFPVSTFNGEEKATWYLSAATKQGDEFFTEVQKSTR
jgi:hypothetical protein